MLLQSQTAEIFDSFTPKGITIPQREKPGHEYQKEDYLQSGLPTEATVLGFGITGSLSIISGKQSTKPFDLSSLTSNAVSSVTAGAGLFLLADSMVALRTASQHCGSEMDYLSLLPYSEYYYPIYEIKDCLLTSVSLTSSFSLTQSQDHIQQVKKSSSRSWI
ncbi:PREDICTED: membrane-spanning 4-domains subfamily A member 7 isoform X3 [Colobus angolensis palliatus]|uniref:Membrane spanning 4-domains A7 n=1 Tax=Colobus angolensis palliatus TaxID=336983 RepID=A0A2K5I0E0_COLAP|nr:PREDICTED: membrane-spanning 4-domains subfamily A member 7 isoform X3 [Colobus angolensis palliatus]